MTFEVSADMYDRHVGRYGNGLAEVMIRAAGVRPGRRALDVGCGPGVLTRALAEVVGAANVAAVDPSEPFVAAVRERVPGADVRRASAESLPFADAAFDAALAQLVVNFMADPALGVAEMRRVTRPGGAVAACVWDYGGEMTLLRAFWDAASDVDPGRAAESDEGRIMGFARPRELGSLFRSQGLQDTSEGEFVVAADYESFDDLWAPFAAGVGPSGAYAASLDERERSSLREQFHRRLGAPTGGFRLRARAWYAVGTV